MKIHEGSIVDIDEESFAVIASDRRRCLLNVKSKNAYVYIRKSVIAAELCIEFEKDLSNDNEDSNIFTERFVTVEPNLVEEVYLTNPNKAKVLILDEDINSLTNGLYIDHLDTCIVAYTDVSIKIANKDTKTIRVKILS